MLLRPWTGGGSGGLGTLEVRIPLPHTPPTRGGPEGAKNLKNKMSQRVSQRVLQKVVSYYFQLWPPPGPLFATTLCDHSLRPLRGSLFATLFATAWGDPGVGGPVRPRMGPGVLRGPGVSPGGSGAVRVGGFRGPEKGRVIPLPNGRERGQGGAAPPLGWGSNRRWWIAPPSGRGHKHWQTN